MTRALLIRIILSSVAFVAVCGALAFGIQHFRNAPTAETKTTMAKPVPAAALPAPAKQDQAAAKLAEAQKAASAVSSALGGLAKPPPPNDGTPAFDVARIEPTGEAVVAGRAAPGATVELLRDGVVHDKAVADQSGQFVMVPPRLPGGTYDLTLRSKQADGKQVTSRQSVAVILAQNPPAGPQASPGSTPKDRPVVALMSPDKPTTVLSQPATTEPITGAKVVVEAVDVEPDGKFHVSGRGRAGATVRLYLNDSAVATAKADTEGRFGFTINKGVVAGDYRVRLDEVDPKGGKVVARAEVPFNVPDALVASTAPAPKPSNPVIAAQPQPAAKPQPAAPPPQQAATTPSQQLATAQTPPASTSAPQPAPTARPKPAAASPSQSQPAATAQTQPPAASRSQPAAAQQQPSAAPSQPQMAAAAHPSAAPEEKALSSTVVVPKITTTTVVRGDSLWRISRRTYGGGIRYAVIYEANRKQIRDPDLIYPGQIFVLPEQ